MRLIDLSRFEDFFNSLQKRLRDKKSRLNHYDGVIESALYEVSVLS